MLGGARPRRTTGVAALVALVSIVALVAIVFRGGASIAALRRVYCVAATYNLENATVPFFKGTVVTVYNYANVGAVNGPNQNKNNMTLCARAVDAKRSGCAPQASHARPTPTHPPPPRGLGGSPWGSCGPRTRSGSVEQ